MQSKKDLLLFLFIIILAILLRFYRITDLMVFRFDQEHQVSLAMSIVKDFHIIWIGVSASNLNFYLGPFWVYFTAFWLFVSKGNPIILAYVASFIGVVTTVLIFLVGREIFGRKVAFFASFLYSSLPLFVFYDRIYWNVTPTPLLAILLFYSIYKFQKERIWLVIFATFYGLVFHAHLSLIFTGFVGFYFFMKARKTTAKRYLFYSFAVFLVVVSPLIIFDYFHKWSNITAPLRIYNSSGVSLSENSKVHFGYFYQALGRIFFLRSSPIITDETPFDCDLIFASDQRARGFMPLSSRTIPSPFVSAIPFAFFIGFMLRPKTWSRPASKLLALMMLAILIPFLIFRGGAFEYYLVGFFPLFLYSLAILITSLPNFVRFFAIGLIFLICVLGVTRVLGADPKYSFYYKSQMIQKVVGIVGDETFELREEGFCHNYEGWRYLFSIFGKTPVRSSTDKSLGWVYQDEISDTKAKYLVVISEARIPLEMDVSAARVIDMGGFRAYVFEN
ncbi:glycosyltransferase family 39 protein [Candidatus Daviesbacteria bacterium]|nr:glycosyltransferase family 39 protein [Candidatus Daviesbacteria bacterium]